ncbi:uncharacterized protein LOC144659340 [Oculina patagonica]
MAAKTIKHELTSPVEAAGVEVVYTNDVFEAESWLRAHIVERSARVVGFDIEWKPQFVSKKKGGTENETAVLQLGVETSCLVLHIYHMSELPKSLISILGDGNILKVGVEIKEDASKLKRHRGLVCEGMVDIRVMAMKSLGIPAKAPKMPKLGLKALTKRFLDIELEKTKKVATSNWENFPLQLRQIEYAALDAWVGVNIYQAIKRQETERTFSDGHCAALDASTGANINQGIKRQEIQRPFYQDHSLRSRRDSPDAWPGANINQGIKRQEIKRPFYQDHSLRSRRDS